MLFGFKSLRFIPAIEIEETEKELEKHTIVYKAKKQKSKKNNLFAVLFLECLPLM